MEPFPTQWFTGELLAQAERYACRVSLRQAEDYLRYTQLLLQWNQRINLTRITAPRELLAKHLLDSIIPARWLPHQGPALDIGSGAGFPGIPLQILLPQLRFVLLESLRKKASFLKVSLAQLELVDAQVVQSRWQDFAQARGTSPLTGYDLITMRALKPTAAMLETAAESLLAEGGRFAFWAGPGAPAANYRSLTPQASNLQRPEIHSYRLPYQSGERHLVVWQKRSRREAVRQQPS